jgi:hypothetical protein
MIVKYSGVTSQKTTIFKEKLVVIYQLNIQEFRKEQYKVKLVVIYQLNIQEFRKEQYKVNLEVITIKYYKSHIKLPPLYSAEVLSVWSLTPSSLYLCMAS